MKYLGSLVSTRVSLVLLIAFAGSMAAATFIENDHGTAVARALVYDAWWFEIIMIWLGINFLCHIGHYKLFHRNRWPIGLFHVAFVIILAGAGVTRYFSKEGIIHIREGSSENTFYTTAHYLQVKHQNEEQPKRFEQPITLISRKFKPKTVEASFNEPGFKVTFEEYITGAREAFESGNETYFDMALAVGGGREDFLITKGNTLPMGNTSLGTTKDAASPIRLFKTDSTWFIHTAVHLQVMEMSTQKIGVVHTGATQPLQLRSLYQWDGGAFIVKSIKENATLVFKAEQDEKLAKDLPNVVKMKVTDQQDQPVTEAYVRLVSFNPAWHPFTYKGQNYSITYGPKAETMPFSLHLKAFELERYPGSQSPASYASEVKVQDAETEFPFRIFMNNVLDYKGYRFYQSSFDTDEKGTVLSVSQDRPGTYLTYLGYFLLALGMVITLFAKGSRFQLLNKKLGTIRKKAAAPKIKTTAIIVLCLLAGQVQAQANLPIVPVEKASAYGRLVVQDLDGRMKPLNTLANEIVRKLNGRAYIDIPTDSGEIRLTSEQFLLAVQLDPVTFSDLPVIKIDKKKSYRAFAALGKEPQERLSFRDFINNDGDYLLHELVEEANLLKPSERNEGHKELLKTDERFNIFYALITGDFLRIFPNKLDDNNTWFTSQQSQQGFAEDDAMFVRNITAFYLSGLQKGLTESNWKEADEALNYMHLFQQKAGTKVYPSEDLLEAELLYNRLNLGNKLFGPFWLVGAFMLLVGITMLFKEARPIQLAWNAGKVLSWLGFAVFTFHLGIRWYIAKHPPWSDGFEMLVFVAWGVLLFGLLFSGKSKFTVPLSLLFSGTLLFVGFLDWLNPEITNLMPVLHSYWLKIHVAIIVSGYAPLALAAILALLSLSFIIFKPVAPKPKWWVSMQELNIVNELSITIGLFLLTVGTFLGGVWANESWGRYWAWDPKETWALISIIVYAFVLHLRLIPVFKNALLFNLASLWAFSSIIMTSFGVNYYLSGLHSYAAGDPVPIPVWVYWVVALLLLISVMAVLRFRQLSEEEKKALAV
ncbi:cytochrome C biogenesis protein [Pontibacter qinzhouensis]|uniref:Cytochrome C biogenesis protein n=1 Tax=Pontibacter qinzhouensis TaxID=2603253 RepID=A0A5C8JFX5_9BACT|nr:cytochrome c biogenesis protein CcsA [Pontibacter qinzhouensis]TXK36488.1 cytochrome C biogenesis protein [Pontibacter qinzhouensis]